MSRRLSRRHNDDSEWDYHKDTIRQLYITEKVQLEGPDGVVDRMQNLYKFYKTPRQYETRFRKWGFRKNRRREDWEIIGTKIAARREAGKESAVYFEGEMLPEKTVDRQTYRNSYDSAFKQHNQASMPETPQGFTVLTPKAENREPFQISNLPCLEFQAAIRLKRSAPKSPNDLEDAVDIRPSYPTSRYPYPTSSGSRTLSEEAFLPESSQATKLHQNTANMYYTTVLPTLKSLFPALALEGYSKSDSRMMPSFEKLNEVYLNLLCFSVANNYAGLAQIPLNEIWDYMRNQISMPGLMQLAPGPTTKALAEKLFRCAIRSGDVQTVEYILQQRCVDANEQVCVIDNVRYTPVELSAKLRDISMTKLLIHYKADVNKTYAKFKFGEEGALRCAIQMHGKSIHVDRRLVHILLDSGANIDTDILEVVINSGNGQVAEILVQKGAHDNREAWIKHGTLHSAVKHLDSETATRIVQIMLQVKAKINHDLTSWRDDLYPRLLDVAAQRGYFDLVQLLLRCGAFLTEDTLTCAIQSENMDLVRHVLHKGAKIDSLSTRFETPYSEAIRNGNMDLVRILEDQGALRNIGEKSRFKAAVCAASEVGNLRVLQSMIQRGSDGYEEELGDALVQASMAGHEEAALLLIDAGANVDKSSRDGPPLCYALERKMGGLVRALLDVGASADCSFGYFPKKRDTLALQIAIDWGDHSIIKDLIFAGSDVNGDTIFSDEIAPYGTPLSKAVKKKDRELICLLLAKGADVNNPLAKRGTALAAAAINGDIDLVRFLLEEGADPDDGTALFEATSQSIDLVYLLLEAFTKRYPRGKKGYGSRALAKAIQEDDVPLLEALLKVNADVGGFCGEGEIRKTPLAIAVEKNNLARVQRLIDTEVDLNSIIVLIPSGLQYLDTRSPRLTVLLVAVCTKNPQMVQLLINEGADVNFAATRGIRRTPLQMAAEVGSLVVVQVLIRNGAKVNAKPAGAGGATALQLAAIGGFIGIAEELLKRGADVNAAPAKLHGRTALEGAAEHGRIDMVWFLLNIHAETRGPGHRQYEKAMKLAKENGHQAVREMLESFLYSGQNIGAGFTLSDDE